MIKVFLVVRWPVGGIRTFINYVYSNWGSPEIQLHILTPNLPEVDVLKNQLQHRDCVWYSTASGTPSFKEFSGMALTVIRSNSFDLIHAHGFTSAFAVAWLLPFVRAKSILTSHDVLNTTQFTGIFGRIKKILFPLLLNRFDCIHSVSAAAQQNLFETLPLISRNKAKVISNGVDTERFYSAEAVDLKGELNLPIGTTLIGFFGRFMSQKGFKFLVNAMVRLEEDYPSNYRVVCFGSGGFIREEKADLKRRNLSHLFYFHDFVPDTAPYVKACDMVAMPSLWEACGLVAMEVLTAGVPLVATSCGGLSEVCQGTPAILVSPANTDELYEAILELNKVGKTQFVDFSPRAKEVFSIKSTVESLQSLYSQLARR